MVVDFTYMQGNPESFGLTPDQLKVFLLEGSGAVILAVLTYFWWRSENKVFEWMKKDKESKDGTNRGESLHAH